MKSQSQNTDKDRDIFNASFKARYDKLNPEQKRAVDAIEGPVLVVAGPGSGKTEILGLRVGNILRQTDIRASNILCLTFTESAASNMRERLASIIGPEAYRVAIYTFHSFSVELIRRYPEYFYGGAFFSPADPIAQTEVLEGIFESLDHKDPLLSIHPEQGFVYLSSAREAIGNLKKSAITPTEFLNIIQKNEDDSARITSILTEAFSERMSMKSIGSIKAAHQKIAAIAKNDTPKTDLPFAYRPLIEIIEQSLSQAIIKAEEENSTKPLSAWKEKNLKKNDNDEHVLRDSLYTEKLKSLAHIYEEYRIKMHQKGFYDFDDMLLDLIIGLEKNPGLRYEIQEQFQYILVDEFQDTNNAQMRILSLLTDAEVNEGRPNIMAVGDDDQAVYKFQGAEISNILDFGRLFRNPETITMTGNYRSTQNILDIARAVITKGEDRLENRMKGMDKTLSALGAHPDGAVVHKSFPTQAHEYTWVAKEIQKLIKEVSPQKITVITRKHRELEELVPYLKTAGIPIRYEHEQNVFDEPHIREIITIARFLTASVEGDHTTSDSFLPTILSFPFWGLKRETIWKTSIVARKEYIPWLDAMEKSDDAHMKAVRDFLIDASVSALHEPLERILDRIIGAHVSLAQESEDDDEVSVSENTTKHQSPFREYYFSKKNFESKRAEYLGFLSSLRVFVGAIREYRQGQPVGIKDLVEFVELHEKNKIPLHDRSPFANAEDAVTLMTAHKAKGLEFEYVFIISCQEDVWAPRARGSYLPFPVNLPITPAGDTLDDKLRLFYVALTRARHTLYLTSYDADEKGNASSHVSFLHGVITGDTEATKEVPDVADVLTSQWLSYHTPPFFGEERALLASLLTEYKMSVTHLNNFLNVVKGGPQCFLEQNLLRFPQAKTVSSAYGTVVHKIIERIYTHTKSTEKEPAIAEVLEWFEQALKRERLAEVDFKNMLNRGREALTAFYEKNKNNFSPEHRIEVDFSKQGVVLHKSDDVAELTGKIDKIVFEEENKLIEVHDFKTGKPKLSWDGGSDYEKIQLHEYERQLTFYKILVEGSRDFSSYKVEKGVLEFVEPTNDGKEVELAYEISEENVLRTKALAIVVYKKIMALDFPDVSKYEQNLKGIKAFEDDLLKEGE